MDRRIFMGSALGSLALGGMPADAEAAARGERPSFAVTPDGAARWRVRSWEWRDHAWRPSIAYLSRTGSRLRIEGPVAAADRAALVAWIRGQSPALANNASS